MIFCQLIELVTTLSLTNLQYTEEYINLKKIGFIIIIEIVKRVNGNIQQKLADRSNYIRRCAIIGIKTLRVYN